MSQVSTEGRKSGLCYYATSADPELRNVFTQLPPSIQAIVKRYAGEEVLSTDELRHLARVSATDRCEALQMLYKGAPVAEVVYFLLLSSAPSSTRASTDTVPAKPGDFPATHTAKTDASAYAPVEKENANAPAMPAEVTRKVDTEEARPAAQAGLRARATANGPAVKAVPKTKPKPPAVHANPNTALTKKATTPVTSVAAKATANRASAGRATGAGGPGTVRGDSVSTFVTVSPISSEEDEDDSVSQHQDNPAHKTVEAAAATAAGGVHKEEEDASPVAISRGLSYGSAYLPATVSSRRQVREPEMLADTPRTVTAPTPSASPAPISVVIPNLALHKVMASAGVAPAAAAAAAPHHEAGDRATSPSLCPPPNARRIVQYVDLQKPAHAPDSATAAAETIDLGTDPRAQALLDLYRRNVLKNEMELEKAYTELSFQRSSVSPCAPPPGGMDWKTFLAHVRQKVSAAETQPAQRKGAQTNTAMNTTTTTMITPVSATVYATKRVSGGGRSRTATAAPASPRDAATGAAGRVSRGTDKTLTPRGTPRGTNASALTSANTPLSSNGTGTPRGRRRVGLQAQVERGHRRAAVAPPQKPCSAWDAARGMYITHPSLLDKDPFWPATTQTRFQYTASRTAFMEPAPQLQPTGRTKGGADKDRRNAFQRSKTIASGVGAVADAPYALRRNNTRTARPEQVVTGLPSARFTRAATATNFTRTPSAPCGFARTASTFASFQRLHSTNGGGVAGLLTSPRPLSSRAPYTAAKGSAPAQRPERLQRTPSRWERAVDTARAPQIAATPRTGPTPRSARPHAAPASGNMKRRPTTPRGQKTAHRGPASPGVFERLTSNFYPCTTAHSNNNYAWRSGAAAAVEAPAQANEITADEAHAEPLRAPATFQRMSSKKVVCAVPEPTPELCSPRPTALHTTPTHTPPQPRSRTSGAQSSRTAGRVTTAAVMSPASTPRSTSYRKAAPIIEVHKRRPMPSTAGAADAHRMPVM